MAIRKCTCTNAHGAAAEYQDKVYGIQQRVHNPCGGKNRGKVRCTVCGDVKTA